jgi:hypothetical protein
MHTVYDDWRHAEAAWREIDPTVAKKFQLHHERMNKFDEILAVFPKDFVRADGWHLSPGKSFAALVETNTNRMRNCPEI